MSVPLGKNLVQNDDKNETDLLLAEETCQVADQLLSTNSIMLKKLHSNIRYLK